MSAALERVIAEQQAEIDRLKAQQSNQLTYNAKDFHRPGKLQEGVTR